MFPLFFFFLILISIVGLALLNKYYNNAATIKRKFSQVRFTNIVDCQDNDIVRLSGMVETYQSTIVAPISKITCLYYEIIVRERDTSEESNMWITLVHSQRAVDFLISEKESNHKALISTRSVLYHMVPREVYHSSYKRGNGIVLNEYLKRHGIDNVKTYESYETCVTENILEAGDIVSVAGKVVWKSTGQLDLDHNEEKILYVKAIDEKTPSFLSNDPFVLK